MRQPWRFPRFATKGVGVFLYRESMGLVQLTDEASVNRPSGRSVVFANRAAIIRHEERVARHREADGLVQPP